MAGRGVPAAPVRAHLEKLVAQGATAAWIAAQAGVSERCVRSVLHAERPTLYAGTAAALVAIAARPGTSHRRVDPGPTIGRVAMLVERHWPVALIADMAGVSARTLAPSNLVTGVSEQTEAAVRAVWEHLEGSDGPAPRAYPWLTQRLADLRHVDVVRGTGLSRATVDRLRAGRPVARATAAAAVRWLAEARSAEHDVRSAAQRR